MIRILVVDDHPLIRRGIKQTLLEQPGMAVTAEAADGEEALELLRRQAFDAIVLDLSMPKMTGLDALQEIRNLHPKLPVLIMTMHSEDQYAVRALRLGASGFLTKDSVPEALVEAIKKITSGGKYVTPAMAERLVVRLEENEKPLHEELSPREFQVLLMIAQGKPPKEMADHFSISPKTISTYRMRIFQKMGFHSTSELVKYCLKHQLLLNEPSTETE